MIDLFAGILKKSPLMLVLVALLGISATANAENYIGLGIGTSELEPSTKNSGLSITDDSDRAWAIFYGKDFDERWGGEIYYHDLGEASLSSGSIDYSALGASALLYFPTNTETLSFYGRAGLNRLSHSGVAGIPGTNGIGTGIGAIPGTPATAGIGSDNEILIGYGAGLRWNMDNMFSRLEYRVYDEDVSAIFLTASFKLGGSNGKSTKMSKASNRSKPARMAKSEEAKPGNKMADADKDGVADDSDSCPGSKRRAKVDSTGCAKLSAEETAAVLAKIDLKGVNFKSSSDELTADSIAELDKAAAVLTENGAVKLEIQAHSDSGGAAAFNLTLSDKRANSVKQYLVGKGIDGSRLTAKGYGEDVPIADNATAEGRAKNRRVEFKTID